MSRFRVSLSLFSAKKHVKGECVHLWQSSWPLLEAGVIMPGAGRLSQVPFYVHLHMLLVTFSPVFLSFTRNRGTQLLAYFCCFCWFWCVFPPNIGPSWVICFEALSVCNVPSVADRHPFPKACLLCFPSRKNDALGNVAFPDDWVSSTLRKKQDLAEVSSIDAQMHLWITFFIIMHMKRPSPPAPLSPEHWAHFRPYPHHSHGN